jgi:hypothetical protein
LNFDFLIALPEAWRLRVENLEFAEALEHFNLGEKKECMQNTLL